MEPPGDVERPVELSTAVGNVDAIAAGEKSKPAALKPKAAAPGLIPSEVFERKFCVFQNL